MPDGFHTDNLCRDPNPRVSPARQFLVYSGVFPIRVNAAADIELLDNGGAAERPCEREGPSEPSGQPLSYDSAKAVKHTRGGD